MSYGNGRLYAKYMLLAGVLAGSIFVSQLCAQTAASTGTNTTSMQTASALPKPAMSSGPTTSLPPHVARKERMYYGLVWGVDSLHVKLVESGEIVRFSWRVTDPERAKPLHDKKIDPVLTDPQAGVQLVVPSMEKVGQLRQSSTPEAGKSYWMAFSNKGRLVKRGDHIDVVIGGFKAQGLIVE